LALLALPAFYYNKIKHGYAKNHEVPSAQYWIGDNVTMTIKIDLFKERYGNAKKCSGT